MLPNLVAAVEVGQIIGLVVLVISVLSWLVNVIKGNTPDGVPRAKQQVSDRSAIDELLAQLQSGKPVPRQDQQPTAARDEMANRKPQFEAKRPLERPAKKLPAIARQSSVPQGLPRVADTHLPESKLGDSLRRSSFGNRVEAVVQRDITDAVRQDISVAVEHDLGNRIMAAGPAAEKRPHPLVSILRNPDGVRQAILLNEILQRPRSVRR